MLISQYIDVNDEDNPVHTTIENFFYDLTTVQESITTIKLSETEFIDKNEKFGFIAYEPDPLTFLQIEQREDTIIDSNITAVQITVDLSNRKNSIER